MRSRTFHGTIGIKFYICYTRFILEHLYYEVLLYMKVEGKSLVQAKVVPSTSTNSDYLSVSRKRPLEF